LSSIRPTLMHAAEKLASLRLRYKLLIIALIALCIYLLSKGPPPGQNHFVYLADAFLHGQLGLSGGGTVLAEVVPYNGNYYVVYPPMPAVLLLPFVAVFGTGFDQALLSVLLASVCVSLTWLMLKKTGANSNKALWLTALFGFGTCFWFTASAGSAWYIEHVVAVLFLTSAIILSLYKKNNFAVGLLLGCAVLARLPVALSFPFFLLMIYGQNSEWKPRIRQAAYFLAGLAIPVGLNALYDFARYGVFTNIGYYLIPGIQEDPFYTLGIFNIAYIPRHIYAILFQGPLLLDSFPYFQPSWMGLALFFTTPAFIYIFKGAFKGGWNSLNKKAALAVLCILPPIITHGTVGFTQFGYRFSLDFTPFLMLLTAAGMRENLGWTEKTLIILSLLVNLWGVVSIIKFNFVSF
jgi:4-amino-4-deoxy-L-arabinose transferase-like glycosyltransferase